MQLERKETVEKLRVPRRNSSIFAGLATYEERDRIQSLLTQKTALEAEDKELLPEMKTARQLLHLLMYKMMNKSVSSSSRRACNRHLREMGYSEREIRTVSSYVAGSLETIDRGNVSADLLLVFRELSKDADAYLSRALSPERTMMEASFIKHCSALTFLEMRFYQTMRAEEEQKAEKGALELGRKKWEIFWHNKLGELAKRAYVTEMLPDGENLSAECEYIKSHYFEQASHAAMNAWMDRGPFSEMSEMDLFRDIQRRGRQAVKMNLERARNSKENLRAALSKSFEEEEEVPPLCEIDAPKSREKRKEKTEEANPLLMLSSRQVS